MVGGWWLVVGGCGCVCFHVFLAFFSRTDLRKGVSRAKFREEFDGEVRLAVAPSNLGENVEKLCARRK